MKYGYEYQRDEIDNNSLKSWDGFPRILKVSSGFVKDVPLFEEFDTHPSNEERNEKHSEILHYVEGE
jgi:hypothetical protein